jgi:peptidylprolyl isomerase
MSRAQLGYTVRFHFTGRLSNGSIFGSSAEDHPIQLILGSEQSIVGLNQALVGMQVGEKKTVTLSEAEGFGPRRPELQQQVSRAALPGGVRVGDRLTAQAGGTRIPVWVRELSDDMAVVDGNHPLAGQTLTFDLELVAIDPGQDAG